PAPARRRAPDADRGRPQREQRRPASGEDPHRASLASSFARLSSGAMTVVVKLGSAIVAGDDGELRSAVLDSVCSQVAELHTGGENVGLVTSGAIARGMRMMGLSGRPGAIDELQAASAVGQGSLFRAYEQRLADADVHAAQVLLTAFDMSARMHYVNARRTLRRLLAWRVVAVVNGNDTTAAHGSTIGVDDFISRPGAILLQDRRLVPPDQPAA